MTRLVLSLLVLLLTAAPALASGSVYVNTGDVDVPPGVTVVTRVDVPVPAGLTEIYAWKPAAEFDPALRDGLRVGVQLWCSDMMISHWATYTPAQAVPETFQGEVMEPGETVSIRVRCTNNTAARVTCKGNAWVRFK